MGIAGGNLLPDLPGDLGIGLIGLIIAAILNGLQISLSHPDIQVLHRALIQGILGIDRSVGRPQAGDILEIEQGLAGTDSG